MSASTTNCALRARAIRPLQLAPKSIFFTIEDTTLNSFLQVAVSFPFFSSTPTQRTAPLLLRASWPPVPPPKFQHLHQPRLLWKKRCLLNRKKVYRHSTSKQVRRKYAAYRLYANSVLSSDYVPVKTIITVRKSRTHTRSTLIYNTDIPCMRKC